MVSGPTRLDELERSLRALQAQLDVGVGQQIHHGEGIQRHLPHMHRSVVVEV